MRKMSLYNDTLNLNKIIIDSRFKSPASVSDSDFIIEIPETITLPAGTRCYVTEVSLCHSWYSIEENVNDKLFFSFTGVPGLNLRFDALITLKPSNYTLDTLTTHLQELFASTIATAPAWVKLNFIPSVMSNPSMGRIYINNVKRDLLLDEGWRFYIWSDEDIQKESFFTAWRGGVYNVMYPGSCNRLLRNFTTRTNSYSNAFGSGFIDLLNHHTIYIRSAQLGTFQNIGP